MTTRPEEGPAVLCPSALGEPTVRFTLCPLCVHLSVCLPDFCLTTASVHPNIILAFWFTISLMLSLSTCLSICQTVCLLVPLSFCLPVQLLFALCCRVLSLSL